MGLILPLIYTILYLVLTSIIFKNKKIITLLPVSIIISILVVYIFSLFTKISIAFYISLFIGIITLIYCLIKKDKDLLKRWMDKDNIWIIIIYILIVLISFNKGFHGWDDYSHWGIMVKESLRLDTFYSIEESTLSIHKDYPPLATLYEIMWVKIIGSYSEAYLIRATTFLGVSFLTPVFDDKNNYLKLAIIFVTTCIFKDLSFLFYQTIYTDVLLSLSISYSLYQTFKKTFDISDLIILALSLSFLVLIKQVGFVFYILCLFSLLINIIFNKIKINKNFIILLLPIIFYKSWDIYISMFEMPIQFSVDLKSLFGFIRILLFKEGESYQYIAGINYLNAIFTKGIFLNLSYVFWVIVFTLILGYISKKDKFNKGIIYFLGALGYSYLMLILYMYSFGPYEGPNLASFDRYLNTYLYVGVILIMYDVCINSIKIQLIYLILGILISNVNLINLKPAFTYESWGNYLYEDYNKILRHIDKDRSIYIVVENDNGIVREMMSYYLNPIYVHGGNIEGITLDEFKSSILSSGYLYVLRSNDYIYENYLYPALKIDYIENGTLFKIEGNFEEIVATKVE